MPRGNRQKFCSPECGAAPPKLPRARPIDAITPYPPEPPPPAAEPPVPAVHDPAPRESPWPPAMELPPREPLRCHVEHSDDVPMAVLARPTGALKLDPIEAAAAHAWLGGYLRSVSTHITRQPHAN
jgi:hypothetical protein